MILSPSKPGPTLADSFAEIERSAESAVDDLARMIAVDTSFPPGAGYDAFVELMDGVLATLGMERRRVDVPEHLWRVAGGPAHGTRTNLIARRRSGKPALGLYFHVDTVPASPGWATDPLRLTRDSHRLIGLGAADMKGTIAAVLLALRAADRIGLPLGYDPMLLFCTDEEGGLYPGIRYLAEQGLLEGHILNFNGVAAPRIWAGCFGLFTLLVRVHGRTVHASEAALAGTGANAIEAALPILNALAALKPEIAKRISALPAAPGARGPLAAQLDISAAHGGQCGGQIPSQFEILVSRRYAPEEDFVAARGEIENTIRKAVPEAEIEIALTGHLTPTSDPTGPHWPRWQEALSAGFGYAPDEFAKWGATSCSDFGWVQATGMQEILLTGLGRSDSRIHAPGEFTTLTDIVALAKSVLAYLSAEFRPDLSPEATAIR
ncbi:M20 family metallopeptidase [Bradyrhizobium sp. GCM10027634]|uniref:M20 family metallopeptidase n=1 Tax=unclassified Bradyrhizobium TaxID=2631580 RepID=UPI00188D43C8|nr:MULTISPECIES: M20/M25/M40 family metallo-hydrolase [unclassified Bradyrhizobium]MDN5005691.1 M20/M25/M40 family metallo-hydrolase [Bradyrhizobium sp. WYCCWR 12677]QOZ44533.1 M20 family peptidase [Bradyrhizobium sp. CCBAU 53340]